MGWVEMNLTSKLVVRGNVQAEFKSSQKSKYPQFLTHCPLLNIVSDFFLWFVGFYAWSAAVLFCLTELVLELKNL